MPFRFLVLLTALLHVYIGLRVLPMIDATSRLAACVVLVALLMSVVTMPLPFLAFRGHGRSIGRRWQWVGLVAMGWFSSMFVATLLRDVVLLGASGAAAAQNDEEMDNATLVLAGVTDFHAAHFDAAHASSPEAALAGAPSGATTRVLLAHQPRSAPAAAAAGFQLQLSGHTHGGQFFPWNLFVPLQQPFTAGLHALGDMWVYTSRGTGYWGPPKRFGAPSEITLVRLVIAGQAR